MSERTAAWQWRLPNTQWREIEAPSHLKPLEVARMAAQNRAENSLRTELDFRIDVKGTNGIVYPYRFKTRRTIEITLM